MEAARDSNFFYLYSELYSIASQNLSFLFLLGFLGKVNNCVYLNTRCSCLYGDAPCRHLSFLENTYLNRDARISCEAEVQILIMCQRTCFKELSMGTV